MNGDSENPDSSDEDYFDAFESEDDFYADEEP